jgi:hypothetical protein
VQAYRPELYTAGEGALERFFGEVEALILAADVRAN